MHIEELVTKIQPLSGDIIKAAQKRFDSLIKPVGSLAQLESMTARYAGILGSSDKELVVIPDNRLLLLWGEAKHAAEIEAAMLQKKAVSVYASHVSAKVIPLLVIGESAYDLLEEGAMLTSEYIGEEKAGLICLGTCEKDLRPDWQDLPEEEDGLAFLDRLQCPSVSAMTGAILQAAGMRVPVMLDGVATWLPLPRPNSIRMCCNTVLQGMNQEKKEALLCCKNCSFRPRCVYPCIMGKVWVR